MDWPWNWWQWLIAAYQGILVLLYLWQFEKPRIALDWYFRPSGRDWSGWLRKIVLKRLLIGLAGWLSVDLFWLYRPWGNWLHGLFPNIGRWSESSSVALELMFIAVVCILSWNRLTRRTRWLS